MADKKALEGIRNGSQESLGRLIDKYGAYVSTIVWNIIGSRMTMADAEEVCSDVFFALWNQANTVQSSSLKGYLAATARNMAKNKLRHAGYDLSLEENILLIDSSDLEDTYASKETAQIVRSTVNSMKEPEREILLRYYYYYQTMDVISKEMGINLSTVKTKLRRSKELLGKALTQKLK